MPSSPASTTSLRALFVDVDGVVNPAGGYGAERYADWGIVNAAIVPDFGLWLNDLIEAGVRVVWATSWVARPDLLRELETELGLPALDQIDVELYRQGRHTDVTSVPPEQRGSGKRLAVADWVRRHRPRRAVWIDDEFGEVDRVWAARAGVLALDATASFGLHTPQLRGVASQHLLGEA